MQKNILKDSAQYIKGVGPKKYILLKKLGIQSVSDILYYFPNRYEDRTNFTPIANLKPKNVETIKIKILTANLRYTKRRKSLFHIAAADTTGTIQAVWFNQSYLRDYLKKGKEVILHGRVDFYDRIQMTSPEYEIITEEDETIHTGRIVPIYSLTHKLNQKALRRIMKNALEFYLKHINDFIPHQIKNRLNLLERRSALENIHFPTSEYKLKIARRRFIFEEFFLFQLIVALKKVSVKTKFRGISYVVKKDLLRRFANTLGFELTSSQLGVIREIIEDMKPNRPMNRLIHGEVGSGKTIVACFAALIAIDNDYQVALMVPTEILAEQHFKTLNRLITPLKIKTGLLISSLPGPVRRDTISRIKQGKINLIIGTHALIQGWVLWL